MPIDFRLIKSIVAQLPIPREDDEWLFRWQERNNSVRSVLGQTADPGMVHSFSWKNQMLPGACVLSFEPSPWNHTYL